MKYKNMLLEIFDDIINRYSLKYIDVAEDKAIFLSRYYALMITVRYDQVFLQYIHESSEKNKYEVYDIWNYCVSQFDEVDRRGIPTDNGIKNSLRATFMILESGLKRHFSSMLEGNKHWIQDYKNYELADKPKPLEKKTMKVIQEYLR